MAKPKVALYWAASCGGCDIAQLQIAEKILKVVEAFDIVFWPIAIDVKYRDVAAMADKSIDVCLFNGGIRNSEQEQIAKLLRNKAKVVVAYGACACSGGIPGLANLFSAGEIMERVYQTTPSTLNREGTYPKVRVEVAEGELDIPELYEDVRSLRQTIEVDYYVPGCPPEEQTTWLALQALMEGKLPPPGAVISGSSKAVCEDCTRKKDVKKVKEFVRTFSKIPAPDICLLEQGFLCAGPATLGGCGAPCPQANMPCTGCYGPLERGQDQGARFLSAVSSIIDSTQPDEIGRILERIPDPAGTFYRYALPESALRRARTK
jgi:F420-non-reducing hydrogenase small subunit